MEGKLKAKSILLKARSLAGFGFILYAFCFMLSCKNGSKENATPASSPKFTQYYNQGQQLYITHCSNCHQKNGTGLGRVYPPLNSSDFMEKNFNEVICLIRYGKKGEVIVNGISFNQPMPGVPSLTDLEIAEIATYIYNSWDHNRGITEVKEVTAILNNCRSN